VQRGGVRDLIKLYKSGKTIDNHQDIRVAKIGFRHWSNGVDV
jgi:hypothetical protein